MHLERNFVSEKTGCQITLCKNIENYQIGEWKSTSKKPSETDYTGVRLDKFDCIPLFIQ